MSDVASASTTIKSTVEAALKIVSAAVSGRRRAHLTASTDDPHRPGARSVHRREIGEVRRPGPRRSGYRRAGSFSRHFRTIVSRSIGRPGWIRDGGAGSAERTCSSVSRTVAARNGGRPVSSSYKIAPSE